MNKPTIALGALAFSIAIATLGACAEDTPAPQPPPPASIASALPTSAPPPADTTPSPPEPPRPSLAERELTAVKSLAAALNAHDPQAYMALFTLDAVRRAPDGRVVDRDGITKIVTNIFARMPDYKFALGRVLQRGDVVVLTGAFTATDSGTGSEGRKPSGRPVGLELAMVLLFTDDGRIKEQHNFMDPATLDAQLDAKAKVGTFRPPPTLPASMDVAQSTGSPDEDKLSALGKAYYASLDAQKMDEIMAPVTDYSVAVDFTRPGEVKGRNAFQEMVGAYFKALPDFHQPLTNQWTIGDTVVTEGTTEGTLKGALGPIRPTGKPVSLHFLDLLKFKDGQLVRAETYANGKELVGEAAAKKK